MPRVKYGALSVEAPEGWTLGSVVLLGPPPSAPPSGGSRGYQSNVIATFDAVGPEETAASYLERVRRHLAQSPVSPEIVAAPEPVDLAGGQQGVLVEQVVRGPTGDVLRQLQLVVVKEGVAHSVVASHADGSDFETVRAEFRRMLLSFT